VLRLAFIIPSHCIAKKLTATILLDGGLAISEQLAAEVLSLPMHAYLDEPSQDRIVAALCRALDG